MIKQRCGELGKVIFRYLTYICTILIFQSVLDLIFANLMKTQLETITRQINRSFSIIFNPNLSDLFFWHYHPEYELVYIEGGSGPRKVGDHSSTYEGSDLVLIGSNIPHLNFDYGIKTEYRKVVFHLKKEFVEANIQPIPELSSLNQLFKKSSYGVAFKGKEKLKIGQRLFDFEKLSPVQQYVELLAVLQELSELDNYELLHEHPYHINFSDKEHSRLQSIYAFVDKNYHRKIDLQEVAQVANLSKEAFCRYFKKATKYTFVEFLNRYRISQSKQYLIAGGSVSDACFHSGFESLSYYNRIFKRIVNENPSAFRKKYI